MSGCLDALRSMPNIVSTPLIMRFSTAMTRLVLKPSRNGTSKKRPPAPAVLSVIDVADAPGGEVTDEATDGSLTQ